MTELDGYVAAVGHEVEARWAAVRHDRAAFPEVAAEALAQLDLPEVAATDVLRSAALGSIPPQTNYRSQFGQPPLTLLRGDDWYLEALFWFDGTTAIHEHAFAGAFQVLVGGSIHVQHEFETERRWSERLEFGTLGVTGTEVLHRGDVRPINWRRAGIHSLFHIEQPSVTLVVRTEKLADGARQLRFTRPGLAYDPFFTEDHLVRRLQALAALHLIDEAKAFDVAVELVRELDHMRGLFVLLNWFELDKGLRHAELTAAYEEVLGTDGIVQAAFADMANERGIAARRKLLRDPRHRLYLAIVLNVLGHADRLRIVEQVFPGREPGETMAEIVGELASRDLRGVSGMVLTPEELESLQATLRRGESADLATTLSDRTRAQQLVKALTA